ncbi:MAG: hypothetical protein AB1483_11985 [Candidatus Zixiibacteriota bacterium]
MLSRRIQWLGTVVLTIVVFTAAAPVVADQYIKQVTITDPVSIMGQNQPGRSDTTVVWIGDTRSSMQSPGKQWVIYDATDNMLYFVDHNKKAYSEMSADIGKAMEEMMPSEEGEGADEEAEMMKGMAQAMMASMEVTVTPTDETKKIKDWDAKKYVVVMKMPMGTTTTDVWATDDIDLDFEMFQNAANGAMALMPGFEKMRQEMLKIHGVTVESVTEANMMGAVIRSTLEVLEWEQKDAPAGTYDIPADYEKVDPMEMQPEM